jgi:phage gp36-like protein
MAYSTLDNLLALVPEDTLIELSSDEDDAIAVDMTVISAAIAQGDSVIDGYVGVQRQVPLDPVPGLVMTISANLAIFNLYRRRNQVPDIWESQYKADVAVLVKISTGQISFGSAVEPAPAPQQTLAHSPGKVLSGAGGLMEGF